MTDELTGFSAPDATFTPAVLREFGTDVFIGTIEKAARVYGGACERAGRNIVTALGAAAVQAGDDFETAWSPGVGYLAEGLRHHEEPHTLVGILLTLLHAASRGAKTEWRLELPREVRVAVQDALLPAASTFDLRTMGDDVTVTATGTAGSATLRLWPEIAFTDSSPLVERLVRARGPWGHVTLWANDARVPSLTSSTLGKLPDVVDAVNPAQGRTIAEAFDLLARVAPEYLTWVGGVMKRILVVKTPSPDIQRCATFDWHLGVCMMSETPRPVGVAEMLVHESSHQYFNLLRLLGPMVEPSHTAMYYSPFMRKDRPLERILVAYHAFANITLFFARCLEQGVPVHVVDAVERDVAQVEPILVEQRAHLTPAGRALFEPLFSRRQALCAVASRTS